jgi:hypothetical protein
LITKVCNYQACSGRIARSRKECQTDQFNIKDLVLRVMKNSMALPAQVASFFGALEYWSAGKTKTGTYIECVVSLLRYSTTPADCRKRGKSIKIA